MRWLISLCLNISEEPSQQTLIEFTLRSQNWHSVAQDGRTQGHKIQSIPYKSIKHIGSLLFALFVLFNAQNIILWRDVMNTNWKRKRIETKWKCRVAARLPLTRFKLTKDVASVVTFRSKWSIGNRGTASIVWLAFFASKTVKTWNFISRYNKNKDTSDDKHYDQKVISQRQIGLDISNVKLLKWK